MTTLELTVKPTEFFRDKVTEAASNQKILLHPEVEFYLVNMLCEFIEIEKINQDVGINILEEPLAFVLKRAWESPKSQQIQLFRRLGDVSLYYSGFFQDFFNGKTFDISYYITLGATAYNKVSELSRTSELTYKDLSDSFSVLVDIVAEVSDLPGFPKKVDLLSTYDNWNQTDSIRLRKILESNGILPIKQKKSMQ